MTFSIQWNYGQSSESFTRQAIDKINQIHGCDPLHIFPAIPVSAAVEMGKLWMNKGDMPLIVYDYNKFFVCID